MNDSRDGRHWFEDVADHLGDAYLRYSFTKGTANEVDFLVEALELRPGERVLDVGCGPGRHAVALAERGLEVVGVDISQRFVDLARARSVAGATFERGDARHLSYDGEFDAVISLCQGAFGLVGDAGPLGGEEPDEAVLAGMSRALRPGGRLALTAFSAYFQLRFLEDSDRFDAWSGVNHEHTSGRGEDGSEAEFDLWTSVFTPRELRLLARSHGLVVDEVWSVTPGAYTAKPAGIDDPEFLVLARRSPA